MSSEIDKLKAKIISLENDLELAYKDRLRIFWTASIYRKHAIALVDAMKQLTEAAAEFEKVKTWNTDSCKDLDDEIQRFKKFKE